MNEGQARNLCRMLYTSHGLARGMQRKFFKNYNQALKIYNESEILYDGFRYHRKEKIVLIVDKRTKKIITVYHARNKNKEIFVHKVEKKDYKGIAIALSNKEKIDYITKEQIKQDIEDGNLFCIKDEQGKITCIGALVFDEKHNSHYIKRVLVLNKKNEGKGLARKLIKNLTRFVKKVCLTPFYDNIKMIKILVDMGFQKVKRFGEKFVLYQKIRV